MPLSRLHPLQSPPPRLSPSPNPSSFLSRFLLVQTASWVMPRSVAIVRGSSGCLERLIRFR